MEHDHIKRTVKIDPFVGNDSDERGGLSNVDKIRGYYDEARNKLKNYLAMGSGSSSPRNQDDGMGAGDGVGGVMFQQRPAHIRLEGKQVMSGEEFTDISYSDLGFIITPQSKKLTLNNNYRGSVVQSANSCMPCSPSPSSSSSTDESTDDENECDVVSSKVLDNTTNPNIGSNSTLSSSAPNINNNSSYGNYNNSNSSNNSKSNSSTSSTRPALGSLQHRGSDGSFTLSQLPGSAKRRLGQVQDKNLDDLRLEEVTT